MLRKHGDASRVGLDSQTVFGMPPIDQISLAAELGCGHVSLMRMPPPWRLDQFPAWSLLDDPVLRRDTKAALRDTGVALAVGEGFVIRPQARQWMYELDLMAELGALGIGSVCMDPDRSRALDDMASLASMAAERDMLFLFEFAPPHTFNTLDAALEALTSIGSPNAKLLIDAMHLFRTGASVDDLAAIDPRSIGYLQLSDAGVTGLEGQEYYKEASFERQCPGDGELPLAQLLSTLMDDTKIGLEIPMLGRLAAAKDVRNEIGAIVSVSCDYLRSVGIVL